MTLSFIFIITFFYNKHALKISRKIFNFIIANRIYVLCIRVFFPAFFIASNCSLLSNRPVISFTNSSIFVIAYLQNISQSLGIFGPAKSRPANSISSYTHNSMVVYYQLS